ncbi:hypothetical protein E2C01_010767 [Portunus trituberculatus]|uniref:Uncharacterized protein n=1 Tax=Portunus trituberculatus TaxID=210409 RepID=A0A5B7D9A2_PORTR|nr:hypothetical protein [Portunus trituberculatus]
MQQGELKDSHQDSYRREATTTSSVLSIHLKAWKVTLSEKEEQGLVNEVYGRYTSALAAHI